MFRLGGSANPRRNELRKKPPEDKVTEIISIRFQKAMLDTLRQRAKKEDCSIADLIRECMERELAG